MQHARVSPVVRSLRIGGPRPATATEQQQKVSNMRFISLAVAAAAMSFPVAAFAQDATAPAPAPADMQAAPAAAPTDMQAPAPADNADTPRAPDGTKAFGLVPYFGVMGGYENFDNETRSYAIPQAINANGTPRNNRHLQGGLVQGVVGVNVPLGPVFAGVEGNVAKGFTGNIDWEYGVSGRFGIRAGDSGMVYGKAGYQWVQIDHFAGLTPGGDTGRKYGDWEYGLGVEVGPKDIGLKGLTNNAGIRLRAEIDTYGAFHSYRPMLGVITHF
jgi:outer membrane immunogenic protein